jgi:CubicO group peptidase (beta-lactamase class C family)
MLRVDFGLRAAALSLFLSPSLAAAQVPLPLGWPTFTKKVQEFVDSARVVGASAAFIKNGRIVTQYNTGFADRAAKVRVDDQTIYHWGSITKALTAISIMQLRDRGRLSLDDKIVRWVPELRTMHDPYGMMDSITLRMLLSHTAGFQGATWPYSADRPWEPFEPTTWNQLVAMMPYQQLEFRPGSRFGYSNPGFIYLARVVEQITGDPWDAYVQKNIFAPLGLDRSYFRSTPYYLAAHRSHNYYVGPDAAGRDSLVDNGADFDPGITSPNGAWNAPLGDLAKYIAFLTNAVLPGMSRERYDVVLKRSSLEEMWKPGKPMAPDSAANPTEWMGLSYFVVDRAGVRLLGHTGHQAGFGSFFYFNPADGSAIVGVWNTQSAYKNASAREAPVMAAALDLLR